MTSGSPVPPTFDDLLAQHSELAAQTGRVLGAITTEAGWEALDLELTRLAHVLSRHFAAEESGGYLSEVLRLVPGEAHRVAELGRTHQELGLALRKLRHSAVDEDVEGIREEFQRWAEALERHEAEEHRLIERAQRAGATVSPRGEDSTHPR